MAPLAPLLLTILLSLSTSFFLVIVVNAEKYTSFDDVSWAITTGHLSRRWGDSRQRHYDHFLRRCREVTGPSQALKICDQNEEQRLRMNLYQPRSVRNYTRTGFLKTRAPDAVFRLIKEFWDKNSHEASEEWPHPTVYQNTWDVPTDMVRVDNSSLPGGGTELQKAISDAAQKSMEEWTGELQTGSSVYGIRIYYNQSILTPHVDRMPLISSAIINVAQDVDEDWALEVYDHGGVAHNVTMAPGDMVLYESHSVIHGRPFPLKGNYFANIFIHFEPFSPLPESWDLPPYLIPGSVWEPQYRAKTPDGWPLGDFRKLVGLGDLRTLKFLSQAQPEKLFEADEVGWQPIHEASRHDRLDVLEFLVEKGADVNAVSLAQATPTPLAVAYQHFERDNHPIVRFLKAHGAVVDPRKSKKEVSANDRSVLVEKSGESFTCFDDVSWAITSGSLSKRWGDSRQAVYDRFLERCREVAGDKAEELCDAQERYRLKRNLLQPRSVRNYTETGFLKIRAPDDVFGLIKDFWDKNKHLATEEWSHPTILHNTWDIPTTMLSVYNRSLAGAGDELQGAISNAARKSLEEWTGQRQAATSVWGVRLYHNQSILTPHVDRIPLISSAIINVAQDVVEDWPLEVYDHDGIAHNVTMKPGDMLLYESHSIIHGRPYPLNGDFYANIFVHFEPYVPLRNAKTSHTTVANDRGATLIGHTKMPPYLLPGTPWEVEYHNMFPDGWHLRNPKRAVERGDLTTLKYLANVKPSVLRQKDDAGWQLIHEACRRGHLEIVKYLVANGADVNAVAPKAADTPTPLSVAKHYLGDNDNLPLIAFLKSRGAVLRPVDEEQNARARLLQLENRAQTYTCFEDVSWAVISRNLSDRWGPEKQAVYDNFIRRCYEVAGERADLFCETEENHRLKMNLLQPRSVRNFTKTGFLKVRAPDAVFRLIKDFWDLNRHLATEEWENPTIYHNTMDFPTTIISVYNKSLSGGTVPLELLQKAISNAAREGMEEWTGQRQATTSVWGIRIYHRNSILTPHVDRLPLISSAIINVAQDVDEDWPLEVFDHDGVGHNVTMKPGDMVFYESHSIIHGRPFPLQGNFYANIFIHFEPVGPLEGLNLSAEPGLLPPYLIKGSDWEPEYLRQNPKGWVVRDPRKLVEKGDLSTLKYIAKSNPSVLHESDPETGWQAIHLACRKGDLEILHYLVENGANVNALTKANVTPLAIARGNLRDTNHPAIRFLESHGAMLRPQNEMLDLPGLSLEAKNGSSHRKMQAEFVEQSTHSCDLQSQE